MSAPMTDEFQSAHPCGVRWTLRFNSCSRKVFQSAHPCGVRSCKCYCVFNNITFQSAHPCGVRFFLLPPAVFCYFISIRAPVWGAIFVVTYNHNVEKHFNPRIRVGCDNARTVRTLRNYLFQSAHPCGVRFRLRLSCTFHVAFQSAHPCGVRLE